MKKNQPLLALGIGLALLVLPHPGSADVWDANDVEDDAVFSDNEVSHGTVQVHDLLAQGGLADQDWYRVQSRPRSSYEATIEGMTGRLSAGSITNPTFDRMSGDGSTVLGSGLGFPGSIFPYSRTLRWQNTTAVGDENYLRVANAGCNTVCDVNDQYTMRFFETTMAIPRFNNAGSQVTVLLIQNPASYTIGGVSFFWDSAGTLLGQSPFSLPAHGLLTLNTASIAPGVGGSVTVTHDGRFSDLVGKAVALEPSTGFSFDSLMVPRAH
jgi:hypothetical protein